MPRMKMEQKVKVVTVVLRERNGEGTTLCIIPWPQNSQSGGQRLDRTQEVAWGDG